MKAAAAAAKDKKSAIHAPIVGREDAANKWPPVSFPAQIDSFSGVFDVPGPRDARRRFKPRERASESSAPQRSGIRRIADMELPHAVFAVAQSRIL